ncbi:MAG: SdpI family protein [Oscillospiraceae bacterium]|nr:SdpI family protein [Oscillospiraceae bacterium]
MHKHWWLTPLYCFLAVAPLAAAFWTFLNLPPTVYITPTMALAIDRVGMWILPVLNALFAVILHPLTDRMAKSAEAKALDRGRATDIAAVAPWIRVFLLALLSGICLTVVYGHATLAQAPLTTALIGRVIALVSGLGTAVVATQLADASEKNTFALRWSYTERSQNVWLRTHKLGATVLHITGAIMTGTGFLLGGLEAVIAVVFALAFALFGLYLYAKRLYEDEFRR